MTQSIPPVVSPRPNAKIAKPATPRNAALYWSLFGVAMFIMLTCALLAFGADISETGAMAILGAIAAILPLPIYIGLFLWLDRFEPEAPHLLIACFAWGAGIAGLFGCIFNTVFHLGIAQVVDPDTAMQATASLSAPLMEETLKGLAVAILFFWRKSDFDGVIDGIIYAGMSALGFATIENVQYYGRGLTHGFADFGVTFFIRGILSPYAHVLFTAMTGIGFGLARQYNILPVKILAPILGWCCAMALHATWNTIPLAGGLALLLSYFIFWIPIFLGLIFLIGFSLRRESRLIRAYLLENPEDSLLIPQDALAASRLLPRLVGNIPILFTGGWSAWMCNRRYQRAAISLAFYRHRLATGRVLPNPDLESQYIEQIVRCRSQLPPPRVHPR